MLLCILITPDWTKHVLTGRDMIPATEVVKIQSDILNEARILRIYLPHDYEQTQKKYPVLIQLDGTARHFPVAVNDIQALSLGDQIPAMIIVGVENTDRWRDMLPVQLSNHPSAGGASNFLDFLQQEVIPYVDRNYRTEPFRILYGRSNSALFTVYALTGNTAAFTGIIAASPSLGHCKEFIFDRLASYLSNQSAPKRFLFISHGGLDTAHRLVSSIPDFIALLDEQGPESLAWDYRYYESEGHCPVPTLRDGLVWFFQHVQADRRQYLGQPPPGSVPIPFAPGLISTEMYSETGCTFTPDGKELYFTRSGGDLESPTIFISRFKDGSWTRPEKAPFAGYGPHIAPGGQTIFASRYGYDAGNQRTTELWYAGRTGDGWSEMQYHGPGNRPSLSRSNNLYYIDRSNEDDRGVIVTQDLIGGDYGESRIMGGGINTPSYEAHPCIAADESYLLLDSNRPGGYGQGDLYVCFRKEDGTWGDAINLGSDINTARYEAYSSRSPDGKYLFFSSNRDGNFDLYWVDLKFLEKSKP
jgi:predicted alpha/beta superfamily hydrolase